jgi:uncharacterized membrane protein YccC
VSELPYRGWRYRWLRLYDAEGRLVPTGEELAAAERERAEAERQRAEQAERRIERERRRAERERQRAEQAERRLAELEAELKRLRGNRRRTLIPIACSKFMNCPPPAGSPRFARGTEPRAHSVPPACRGNLKEGVVNYACFYELWQRDW